MTWNEPRRLYFRHGNLPLCIFRQDAQLPTGVHGHEFSELVMVTRGQAVHVFGSDDSRPLDIRPVSEGDVFVIHDTHRHGYRETSGFALVNVIYDLRELPLVFPEDGRFPAFRALFDPAWGPDERRSGPRRLHPAADVFRRGLELVGSVENELESTQPGFETMAASHFGELLVLLARNYTTEEEPSGKWPAWLTVVTSYLESNFSKAIDLEHLAAIAHTSPSNLSHTFKRALGTPPIDYLLSLRIQHSAERLRDTEMSVTEVAFESGFTDSNYFSRQFRRRMGYSPLRYREHCRLLERARSLLGSV